MFQVLLTMPLTEWTEDTDIEIFEEAGRSSNFSGSTQFYREHGWLVKTFKDAQQLKKHLESIFLANETIREHTSSCIR